MRVILIINSKKLVLGKYIVLGPKWMFLTNSGSGLKINFSLIQWKELRGT